MTESLRIKALIFILAAAFLIRIYNLSIPYLTSDEARIAYRGYTLATTGKDELGRKFPLIFNSTYDYQLPAVSYITALGVLLFGKNDVGARIPFILISLLIVILIFKLAGKFSTDKMFSLYCAFVAAFSPALIFFSKIPNEMIVITLSLVLLFDLLTREKANLLSAGILIAFSLTVSKFAWWILVPFVIFTLIFQAHLQIRSKLRIISLTIFLTIVAVFIFMKVPQSTRSLLENNFSIFQDTSIQVAANRLRGQGLESGWPKIGERVIFNKLQFINVGFFNWVNFLGPTMLFSQLDQTGIQGFFGMGAFPKMLIIPFVAGLIFIIRKGNRSSKSLIFYSLLLTFPLFFTYPGSRQNVVTIIVPFLTPIIALGFLNLNYLIKNTVLILLGIEILAGTFYFSPEVKNAQSFRPVWIRQIVEDSYKLSINSKVAVSDNLVLDISPYFGWLSSLGTVSSYEKIGFPYKFHQTDLGSIKIIGTEDIFYFCGMDKPTYVVASQRDLEKIQRWLNIDTSKTVQRIFLDNLGERRAYLLKPTICVH